MSRDGGQVSLFAALTSMKDDSRYRYFLMQCERRKTEACPHLGIWTFIVSIFTGTFDFSIVDDNWAIVDDCSKRPQWGAFLRKRQAFC